ncbi:MAG: DUF1343 domain-containing protein [Gemmatimonadota bacterium]
MILLLLAGIVACGSGDARQPPADPEAGQAREQGEPERPVLPGIDVLLQDSVHLVRSLRAGLVTNQTGIDRDRVSAIDRLAGSEEVELVALFSPEHGIRGEAEAGVRVEGETDSRTGLPVHSLYGSTLKPTPEMLNGLDVLLFDIQDIGTRYYTYIYTMAYAMEAAGEADIPLVVLDRPNPIGGAAVHGNVLDPAFSSFVGMYPLPIRHGMTPGELARLFRDRESIDVELHVVPVQQWRRDMSFDDTGLPWVPPSPNMPSVESALHYPGTCLFEGTSLSVGRGTDAAFQQFGAPWLDGALLAERLNAYDLPGVGFEAVRFTPENPGDGKFGGQDVEGVRFVSEFSASGTAYDPVLAGVAAVIEARRMSGERFTWRTAHFDRLAGTDRLRLGILDGRSAFELRDGWMAELAAFRELREGYLIYP